jgi:hypothetical protein
LEKFGQTRDRLGREDGRSGRDLSLSECGAVRTNWAILRI